MKMSELHHDRSVYRLHKEVWDHSQHRYRTGTSGQRVEEVAERVDFTRDRNVGPPPTEPVTDRVAITTDRASTDRGRQSNLVVTAAAPRRPGGSGPTTPRPRWWRYFRRRRAAAVGVHQRPRPYRYDGGTGRRPIDTVDRPRAPQLSEICKAKRLLGPATTSRKRICEETKNDILSLSSSQQILFRLAKRSHLCMESAVLKLPSRLLKYRR